MPSGDTNNGTFTALAKPDDGIEHASVVASSSGSFF
jgi:hypothetical protein